MSLFSIYTLMGVFVLGGGLYLSNLWNDFELRYKLKSLRMGRVYLTYLQNDQVYICKNCHTHITSPDEVISRVTISFISICLEIPWADGHRLPVWSSVCFWWVERDCLGRMWSRDPLRTSIWPLAGIWLRTFLVSIAALLLGGPM